MREFMNIVESAEFETLKAKMIAVGWKNLSAEDKALFAVLYKAHVQEPASEPTSPLADLLNQWAEGYDAEDVWTGNRMAFDKEIIEACADLNHTVTGMLYRGQGVRDDIIDKIEAGAAETDQTKTLLTSWTKSKKVARGFADVAYENHGMSSVVIAYPANKLKVVVDFEQVPGADRAEREVICMHQPIPLSSATVIAHRRWED